MVCACNIQPPGAREPMHSYSIKMTKGIKRKSEHATLHSFNAGQITTGINTVHQKYKALAWPCKKKTSPGGAKCTVCADHASRKLGDPDAARGSIGVHARVVGVHCKRGDGLPPVEAPLGSSRAAAGQAAVGGVLAAAPVALPGAAAHLVAPAKQPRCCCQVQLKLGDCRIGVGSIGTE